MAAVTGGQSVITGSLDEGAARLLAAELAGGRLPVKLVVTVNQIASTPTP